MVTRSKWVERIGAWHESKLSAEEFCQGRSFSVRAMRAAAAGICEAPAAVEPASGELGRIVRVAVARERPVVPHPSGISQSWGDAEVVLEVAGTRVAVRGSCSQQTLAMVVGVLRGAHL